MLKKSLIIAAGIISLEVFSLYKCGYPEKGHSNTPAEYPGSQMKVGVDTLAHPGNMDKDTLQMHQKNP
jgi:hypothetical protein